MIIQFAQSLYLFCNLVSFTHHTLTCTCTLPSFPSLPSSSWECSWGLPIRRPSAFLSCMYSPMTLLLVCLTYYKLSRVPLPNSFHPSVHEDQPTAVNCDSSPDFVQWDNGNIILLSLKKTPKHWVCCITLALQSEMALILIQWLGIIKCIEVGLNFVFPFELWALFTCNVWMEYFWL